VTARRYWRIAQVESYGYAGLELSDVALYAGASRVDGSATLTSTVSPTSGALSSLSDGAFTPTVRWDEPPALPAGFALVWDFGVGATADITSVGIAGPTQSAFLHRFVLQSGDDGVAWSAVAIPVPATKFPGAAGFYTLLVADYNPNIIMLLTMDGANSNPTVTDSVGGNLILSVGAPRISTAQSKDGGSSLYLDGSSYVRCNTLAAQLAGVGTYTLEGWFFLTAIMGGQNALFGLHDASGNNILVVTRSAAFGDSFILDFPTALAVGGWHHVAACHTPTLVTAWMDGASVGSAAASAYTILTTAVFSIGQEFDSGMSPSDYMQGYVDIFRVTKNEALYTAPFSPPSPPDYDPTPLRAGPYYGPHRMVSAFAPSDVTQSFISPAPASLDREHAGDGRIVGTTKNAGDPDDYPVSRRVRLLRKRDGVLARETWSNAAGDYVFEHIRSDIEYVIVSHDHTGLYNAAIADSQTPELMP
jgi:hypothetical protein